MKTSIARLGLTACSIALAGWLFAETGGPDPANRSENSANRSPISPPDPIVADLQRKLEQLEQRIQTLERQLEDGQNDDDWKARATENRVVNGTRVYVVPLTHSRLKPAETDHREP